MATALYLFFTLALTLTVVLIVEEIRDVVWRTQSNKRFDLEAADVGLLTLYPAQHR